MSNFRKRVVGVPIPGTRTSSQTGQVITSTGNPSLDVIFGGGLPVGSLCLIEEDKFVTYSKVLAKYFMAEGVLSKQSILLASLDDQPKELLKKLPQHCAEVIKDNSPEVAEEKKLRIAWRYNDLPMVNSKQSNEVIGHNFNLMEFIDPQLLKFAPIYTWNDATDNDIAENDETECVGKNADIDVEMENYSTFENDSSKELDSENPKNISTTNLSVNNDDKQQDLSDDKTATASVDTSTTTSIPLSFLEDDNKFNRLLKDIQNCLDGAVFHPAAFALNRSLLRICITSLGSPQWYDENFGKDLLKFLTILRALIRSKVAVCFITMPMHLVAKYDETLVARIRNLVDYSIELESFAGSDKETNPAFKEYNGLFQLHKMAAVNTLSAYMPETIDLAFKLKRKKFVIEKLHLPPELQDNTEETKPNAKPKLSCGNNDSPNTISMDF